jgi:hypothetical protein
VTPSPPAKKEIANPGQVDPKQGDEGYQGTKVVRDNGAFAYRLVHRLSQRRALPKQG